ncbi:MAG: NAD(P)-binding domain-containing protein [Clostridia bacterium]|nr:NAD(P)-binding domain-containing protein [Clostridia bacterium]
MKIAVLGCGRWGSFITWYLSTFGHDVVEWGREDGKSFLELKTTGKNQYVKLNSNVKLTSNLVEAVNGVDLIIVSVLSQSLRQVLTELYSVSDKNVPLLLCMKGLETETGKRLSEIAVECGFNENNVAVWLGPGHIQEFTNGKPNCMVIDSANYDLTVRLADSLRTNLIRFYYGDDLIGNEIGAASKNVIGIAAGMLDGGGYTALKGSLMARGAREISRLIKKMGGNELSAYGLCHLGDYETTLFSDYSHNRAYGIAYVKGDKFIKSAEGVATCKALKLLGEKYGEELPICNAVYNIIYNKKDPKETFDGLFGRSSRKEFQ